MFLSLGWLLQAGFTVARTAGGSHAVLSVVRGSECERPTASLQDRVSTSAAGSIV